MQGLTCDLAPEVDHFKADRVLELVQGQFELGALIDVEGDGASGGEVLDLLGERVGVH